MFSHFIYYYDILKVSYYSAFENKLEVEIREYNKLLQIGMNFSKMN